MANLSGGSRGPGPLMRFFFGRLFPLPFLLVGLGLAGFGIRDCLRASASTGWPEAAGVIRESQVEWRSGSKGGGTYHARIRYEFRAEGELRSGDKVGFGDFGTSGSSHAQEVVNRYPAGKTVSVRHLPGNPTVAVLEPGLHAAAFAQPVFGAVFAAAGAAMLIFLPGLLRRQAEVAAEGDREERVSPAAAGAPESGVVESESHEGVSLETRMPALIPVILATVAAGQLAIVSGLALAGKLGGVVVVFLVADSLLLAAATLLFRSRIRVTVSADAVRLFIGTGRFGLRREIGRTRDMRVTLAPRGTQKNGVPVKSVVVTNRDGAEFHFGSLLAEPRKRWLASRLAALLGVSGESGGAGEAPGANPFAG